MGDAELRLHDRKAKKQTQKSAPESLFSSKNRVTNVIKGPCLDFMKADLCLNDLGTILITDLCF